MSWKLAIHFLKSGSAHDLTVLLQPYFRRDFQSRPRVKWVQERTWGFATLLEDFRVACLDLPLPFGVDWAIPERRTVIRRALEDGPMGDFISNFRYKLNCGGPGAYDPHTLDG